MCIVKLSFRVLLHYCKCQLAVNAFGMINISANIVAEAVLYNVHADAAENVTVNLVSVDADGCVVCVCRCCMCCSRCWCCNGNC